MICMFSAEALSSGYGGTPMLRGLSFQVEKGSVTALIGPNGSGKSTLLRVLGGIKDYSGAAALDGREIKKITRAEFGRMVGFVPQHNKISLPYSVYEVIAMGRLPYCGIFGRMTGADDAAVLEAAELAGVARLLFRRADELSGGEQQRVSFATALAQKPDVFLLDEPTSALDPNQSSRLFSILRALARAGKTVIVAAHDLNSSLPFSDRFIALRGGEIAAQGRAAELDGAVLEWLYGIKFIKYTSDRGGCAWHPLAENVSLQRP